MTRGYWFVSLLLLTPVGARAADTAPAKPSPEGVEFFEKKVRPVLVKHCYSCHSADAKKLKGELRLDTRDGVLQGGSSGPAIVPGDPDKSLLIQAVKHADEDLKMPPDSKLSAGEIADLTAWVKLGAPDPRTGTTIVKGIDFDKARESWPFQPVRRPAVPEIANLKLPISNPVDAFILAKLQAKGLKPVGPADKRTLIRRATYDLIGLPPTPEQIDAFLKDDSPRAFAKVVDRLLASPHYGERWGRHWLDVVRYSDTAGDNSDYPVPQMYRYRNWVIDAFNRDLPYDEFIRQQLAGDLLPAKDEADRNAKIIATGYLANSKRFGSYEDARYPWYLTYEDTIDNLGRAFLGLTIGCARCHDHKFDPVTQADYYALYGFFSSTRYPRPGIELDKVQHDFVPLASPQEVAAFEKERQQKQTELNAKVRKLEADRKAAEKTLADAEKIKNEKEREKRIADLNKQLNDFKKKINAARKAAEEFAKHPMPFETAYAVAEGKTEGKRKVGDACIQIKGDPERLGPEVPRRFLQVLGGQKLSSGENGSGRFHLANWIADARNPLTARVMVNRIWHYHFGKGLVPSPNNFGKLGGEPTHPELLDFLADEFIKNGWSVKKMHRLIMLSDAYQRSSRDDEANAEIDIANDFLWRFDRCRLDAESIRDTLLAVGGNLDRTPLNEPHPFPPMAKWNFTQHNPFKAVYDSNKRSVYLMTQRIQRHPFLALFDGPDTNASTATRITSTTPLQSLYLMNDPFVHGQAKKFAERLLAERTKDADRFARAYVLLYGRPPTAEEKSLALEYLKKASAMSEGNKAAAWESLSRALLLSNEFVYLD